MLAQGPSGGASSICVPDCQEVFGLALPEQELFDEAYGNVRGVQFPNLGAPPAGESELCPQLLCSPLLSLLACSMVKPDWSTWVLSSGMLVNV